MSDSTTPPPDQSHRPDQPQPPYPPPPPDQPQPPYPPPPDQPPTAYAPTAGAPADLMSRFAAKLIDWVLLVIVLGVVFGLLGAVTFGLGVSGGYFFGVLTTLLATALVLGYFALMESTRGQTVGKMLLSLRVQNLAGQNPSMEEALKRNAYLALSLIGIVPVIGGLVGGLASLAATISIAVTISGDTQWRRGWHDQFGGTRVVRTS